MMNFPLPSHPRKIDVHPKSGLSDTCQNSDYGVFSSDNGAEK